MRSSNTGSAKVDSCRKWFGVVWLLIELNLVSMNILGFPALFKVLPKYGIYEKYCQSSNSSNSTEQDCSGQTQQYQNALTLGIIFFNLPSMFVGISIDHFGCRFTKLIGVLFHIVGWLSLALLKPGRDSLLYVHTMFMSLAGIITQITAYASCNYFSKSRGFIMTLFTGASMSSSIWFSIFQILIDNNRLTLSQLSYIWLSFALLMFFSSFLFLDWKFPILNLPYRSEIQSEPTETVKVEETSMIKWYQKIYQRVGIWKHLTSPLYISTVLFLAFVVIPSILLSVTWYPWVYYLNNNDKVKADQYTLAFNLSTLSSIVLCPIVGFLLVFRMDRSPQQKVLNISIVQTCTWVLNFIACFIDMFTKVTSIVPALVFYCIGRSAVAAGSQAVIFTFFPSQYVGSLIGIMWTITGIITFIQYGLVRLTVDVPQSWRAWAIVLALIVLVSCHLVQLWMMYFRKVRKHKPKTDRSTNA